MATPLKYSDFESLFDPNRKPLYVGKSKDWWYKHGRVMTEQSAFVADSDCRGLVGRVLELQRDDYWRQFNDDWGEFCLEAFGRPAEWIEQVMEGVRVLHLQEPSRFDQPLPASEAIELKAHGRPRKVNEKKDNNVIFSESPNRQGNSADYSKARLRRDHPEIAEELERGEHRSARAAGIAAGFIKDVPTIRMADPVKAARLAHSKLDSDFLKQFLAELLKLSSSQS